MSSDSPSGQSTSVVNKEPWAAQQPFLETGFDRAQTDVLDKPITAYPNSQVVPFANQTTAGLNSAEARAMAGSPLLNASNQGLTDTASGNYLNSNPNFDAAVNAATRPMIQNFNDTVLPGIQGGFAGKGRYGSGLQAYQQQKAGEALTRNIGDVSGSMAFKNYGDERQRMMQAGALAPQASAAEYIDSSELERIGGVREGQAGAELQDDISKYMQAQTAPQDALSNYMRLVGGGGFGGATTKQQPIYRNSMGEGLGAAASIAGIGGSLFGGGGPLASMNPFG